MVKRKRIRAIAEMARKVRAYRELKSRPRDSEKYALDYESMRRPLSGGRLPVLAWQDVRRECRLFSLMAGMRMFGVGRLFTRKSWLEEHSEPCYWQITRVRVDYTAENMDHGKAWGVLTFRGKQEEDVKEVDKVMYHDWRVVPKHMEQTFRDFQPLPDPAPRYIHYPPLLRAMLLAQLKKAGRPVQEPLLALLLDAGAPQGQSSGAEGTAV
ncbi:small ribosomal subunit protein mS34 isoform 2-T4 [Synchiropus picturatus]